MWIISEFAAIRPQSAARINGASNFLPQSAPGKSVWNKHLFGPDPG
jgi:hypothetical protein